MQQCVLCLFTLTRITISSAHIYRGIYGGKLFVLAKTHCATRKFLEYEPQRLNELPANVKAERAFFIRDFKRPLSPVPCFITLIFLAEIMSLAMLS